MVEFQWCKLFKDTFTEKARANPGLPAIFNEFIQAKTQEPTKPFGAKDSLFGGKGPLTGIPKLRHTHLMHDLNLCYTILGKDPTVIKLYGVFKHDELGSGQPNNISRQKGAITTMANQTFEPMPGEPKKPEPKKADDYKQSDWYKNQNK